jgi:hypothetical protein
MIALAGTCGCYHDGMKRVASRQLFSSRVRSALQGVRNLWPSGTKIDRRWREADLSNWPPERSLTEGDGWQGWEYSVFSQNGEDGIIRSLLSRIGPRTRLFLEFGFSPVQCNCLRLAVKEGFGGVFIDGDKNRVREFRRAARCFGLRNVNALARFLTVENLERTVIEAGLGGEIDVASIDVDGNDYWLWEKLECVSPRVVVIEYNASLGPAVSVTVPYDPTFDRHRKHPSGLYHGASLTALQRLGNRKGYRLVGCDSAGVNAFFLRDDIDAGVETVTPEMAFRPSASRLKEGSSLESQYRTIANLPYVTIE